MQPVADAIDVAISPCPNDTFAFCTLRQYPEYRLHYLDIEELNRGLLQSRFPISKGSIALIDRIADSYSLLPVGAAVGHGVGPVLVGRLFDGCRLALPGENTTAHRLFLFYQRTVHPTLRFSLHQMPFFAILPALRQREIDAAVLIHEGRFVYAREGLALVEDLGDWYEKKTGAMIPLGAIYARKDLPAATVKTFVTHLRQAIHTARKAYQSGSSLYSDTILPFMRAMAQEHEDNVIEAHVATYVTADTEELSAAALKSIDIFRETCLARPA
jgi:1,4-dihydroxy-6-naphthoate synthase